MKKVLVLVCMAFAVVATISCKNTTDTSKPFAFDAHLDSLKKGLTVVGDKENTDATIRALNYQKKYGCGETNGTYIPKSLLTQAVNGFTQKGINLPLDSSNYAKWDFLVVYPGIAIDAQGHEVSEPAVFYYKGGLDASGNFVPKGKPVTDLKFMGGGGGDGIKTGTSPPPTL